MSRSLLRKGYEVIGTSRKEICEKSNLHRVGVNEKIKTEKGDVKDIKFVRKLIEKYEPNEIYNLTGQSSVGKSFNYPIVTCESIISATLNILETSRILDYQGYIFFAGSSEMFENTETAASINHDQKPENPYAIAKQASFNLVKLYRESNNIKCVTGVLFNHESPLRDERFVTQKIISGAVKTSRDRSHKINLGNINIERDWGWAEEYIEAMQLIIKSKEIKDYVICTGKLTPLTQFINIAYNRFNLNWKDHIVIDNSFKRKSDIKKSFGNPNDMEKDFRWKAKINIEDIIYRMIDEKLRAI